MAVTRSPTATWVIPTNNEWYKSAYYVGGGTNAGYWLYPTQDNDAPVSNLLSTAGTNNANFFSTVTDSNTDPVNFLTSVGAFGALPGLTEPTTREGRMAMAGDRERHRSRGARRVIRRHLKLFAKPGRAAPLRVRAT